MNTYYRPVWTCGRYDINTHSAIYYNLLTGMAYFVEDASAVVVGAILSTPRGELIDIVHICESVGIEQDIVTDFFDELVNIGGVTCDRPTDITLSHERTKVSKNRKQKNQCQIMSPDPMSAMDAERDYQQRAKPGVFSLLIELTYNCSAQCVHCYNPGAARNSNDANNRLNDRELDLNDYKRIIDDLYDNGLVRVCLSGGDPFSKPIIWEVIDYLYSKDIVFDIYTNGQLLDGYEAKLANYFPCSVGLSIYSNLPEIHDRITRKKGSLKRILSVADKLSELAVPLQIKCCIMRLNCKYYRGVVDIANKYSASLQLECNIFDSVDGDTCVSTYLRLKPSELKIILRDKNVPLYVGPELPDFGAKNLPKDRNICGAGYGGFCLTPDGTLTLCVSFQSAVGDMTKDNFQSILNNQNLKKWRKTKLSEYEECGKHDYCDFCPLCPGLNFSKHGTPLKASENNCYVAKIRKELAQSIKNGLDPLGDRTIDEALEELPVIEIKDIVRKKEKNYYKKEIMGTCDSL